jgi:peptidoglycan/xylan/chitin deacetylase (PgdA/CDA1 family)
MTSHIKSAILYTARALGMFWLCRNITRSQHRILCYHGGAIGDEGSYNPKLFLSSKIFQQRIGWMQTKGFRFATLDDLTQDDKPLQPLTTVITFDDGWYSTASELIPVLGASRIPSTLYLCTSHFADGAPVLAVTIRYILWRSTLVQVVLSGYDTAIDGVHSLNGPAAREELARKVIGWLEPLRSDKHRLCEAIEQFASTVGVSSADLQLASRRFQYMSADDLRALPAQHCAVELHGHVHRYPKNDPVAFENDLRLCLDVINQAGLPRPRHYCYPSGNSDSGAAGVLSKLGVASGTLCTAGLVSKVNDGNRYFLPRFLDGGNVTMLEFEAEMSGFSNILRRLAGRR